MLDTILQPLEYLVSAILLGVHSVLGPIVGRDSGWSWGPSIVVLVVIIRICLIPLFVRQIRAQRGLQLLQPRMVELRKKYGAYRASQCPTAPRIHTIVGRPARRPASRRGTSQTICDRLVLLGETFQDRALLALWRIVTSLLHEVKGGGGRGFDYPHLR